MIRKPFPLGRQIAAAAVLAIGASGIALADDSSMSMWTGDSYAYFNNLDSAPAKFNMARAPRMPEQDEMAKSRGKANAEPMMSASHRARGTPTNPFRDDAGA
jgi:hypothetical protein